MPQISLKDASCSNYQSIFDSALEGYKKKTGKDLTKNPLLRSLETCGSPDAVLTILRAQLLGPGQSQSSRDNLTTWLNPTVNVISAFSATIGGGVGLVYPPAGVIFTGIGVLLSAIKDVTASRGPFVDIFTRIENIFRRLETYIEVPPTPRMTDAIVAVMVEVLCVLAIATKEIKQNHAKMFLKKLAGRKDMEDALQRLENVTLEETRMTGVETLRAIHGIGGQVGDKMRDALQAVHDRVGGVEGMLQGVMEMLQGAGDGLPPTAPTLEHVNSTLLMTLPQPPTNFKPVNNTPLVTLPSAQTFKPVNDIPLTRMLLRQVLLDLSERTFRSFRRKVRLVVHGGAVMVLHPACSHREFTQDVNYIHRSFVSEYRALGFPDAEQRLRTCIAETAYRFNLGANWMNDHADMALPWALDQQGLTYDPIFYNSTIQQNAAAQTIFNERGLALVAVPWPWAIALKLVRYDKKDREDCTAVLRIGASQRGIRWTVAGLEQWISERCWPMQYSAYQPAQKAELRERLQETLARAFPESFQPQSQSQFQSWSQTLLSPLSFAPIQQLKNEIPLHFM